MLLLLPLGEIRGELLGEIFGDPLGDIFGDRGGDRGGDCGADPTETDLGDVERERSAVSDTCEISIGFTLGRAGGAELVLLLCSESSTDCSDSTDDAIEEPTEYDREAEDILGGMADAAAGVGTEESPVQFHWWLSTTGGG